MSEILTGFLPAGGQGGRLRPHTDNVPKPLLLMGSADKQLIDVPLTIMGECDNTFVSTHYQAELLGSKLRDYRNVTLLHEGRPLGNAGAFVEHYNLLAGLDKDGDTVIIPSDPVCR
ncbi:MAG TPA: sugar phosphate nucleotidyltransferase [Candidatus Saccharimonadales bacterium]|nr:sugar phosphate nucleotidyltransferase [Candidatus Saccharimonadales bacterium]